MYSWEHEVNLCQITPLIHFQSNEKEATLRVTEVKPKLDRFLLWARNPALLRAAKDGKAERAALWTIYDQLPETWRLPAINREADPALRYKLRIQAPNCQEINLKSLGAYFSVKNVSAKKGILYKRPIRLKVVCFERALLQQLQELLPMFFAVHNFGFRKNKGFGSFVVQGSETRQEMLIRSYVKRLNGQERAQAKLYELKPQKAGDYRSILNLIADFCQRTKSGINRGIGYLPKSHNKMQDGTNTAKPQETYIPSTLLKEYIPHCHRDWLNEKKTMKLMLAQAGLEVKSRLPKERLHPRELEQKKKRYVRGVLGFANHYQFRNVRYMNHPKGEEKTAKFNLTIRESDEKGSDAAIQRFSNPLYFLPIYAAGKVEKALLLVSNRLLKRVQAAALQLELTPIDWIDGKVKEQPLSLPSAAEFDLLAFMDYIVRKQSVEEDQEESKSIREYALLPVELGEEGGANGQ